MGGIVEMLLRVESQRLEPQTDIEAAKTPLAGRYFEALRRREERMRSALRGLYAHHNLAVESTPLESADSDLFDLSSWSRIGLSRAQLTTGGGAAGALVGGAVDAAAGGASFLLGSLIGAAAGGVSAWWGFDRLAEVEVLGRRMAGPLLSIGPMKSAAFAWVVLGRALLFHHIVSTRAHAARSAVAAESSATEQRASELPAATRRKIGAIFKRIDGNPGPIECNEIRRDLSDAIEDLLGRETR
jgi:hypothetical protein